MGRNATRHFLIDNEFDDGEIFCTQLLSTGEFNLNLLRQFGGQGNKSFASADVARKVVAGALDVAELLEDFCQQPRQWLYLAETPSIQNMKSGRDGLQFLTQFGVDGWYGPFSVADKATHWWVFSKAIRHVVRTDDFGEERFEKRRVRWHLVAEVRQRKLALHWNNFDHCEDEEAAQRSPSQFTYWKHVPKALAALATLLGFSADEIRPPSLSELVFDKLMNRYEGDADANWQHLRIRAESEGVAMNARSSPAKISDLDVGGIRRLTEALANSVLDGCGYEIADAKSNIESAILRTLVREWGTASYEFCMDPKVGTENRFRGHVYFGNRSEKFGPDSLPHCKCFQNYGGSRSAREFLERHLFDG